MNEIPIQWNIQPEKWAAMFCSASFRQGWDDARAGRPSPPGSVEQHAISLKDGSEQVLGRVKVAQADVDIIYVLGRLMALETASLKLQLPDPVGYLSIQMKMVIEACPAMIQNLVTEFRISAEGQKALAAVVDDFNRRKQEQKT